MILPIAVSRYEELLLAERELNALRRHGVDNWEWYGDAMDSVYEEGETTSVYDEGEEGAL